MNYDKINKKNLFFKKVNLKSMKKNKYFTCKPFSSFIKLTISRKIETCCEIDRNTYKKILMKCGISMPFANFIYDYKDSNITDNENVKFRFKKCKKQKDINKKMLFKFEDQIIKACIFKGAIYMSLIQQLEVDKNCSGVQIELIQKFIKRYRCICKIEKQLKNFILKNQSL